VENKKDMLESMMQDASDIIILLIAMHACIQIGNYLGTGNSMIIICSTTGAIFFRIRKIKAGIKWMDTYHT